MCRVREATGPAVVLSDDDLFFYSARVERSELSEAVDGSVLTYVLYFFIETGQSNRVVIACRNSKEGLLDEETQKAV